MEKQWQNRSKNITQSHFLSKTPTTTPQARQGDMSPIAACAKRVIGRNPLVTESAVTSLLNHPQLDRRIRFFLRAPVLDGRFLDRVCSVVRRIVRGGKLFTHFYFSWGARLKKELQRAETSLRVSLANANFFAGEQKRTHQGRRRRRAQA